MRHFMPGSRGIWCGLDGPTCPTCLAEMAAQGMVERKPRITTEDVQRLVEEGVELRHEFEARTSRTRGIK